MPNVAPFLLLKVQCLAGRIVEKQLDRSQQGIEAMWHELWHAVADIPSSPPQSDRVRNVGRAFVDIEIERRQKRAERMMAEMAVIAGSEP